MLLVGSYSKDENLKSLYKLEFENRELKLIDTIESGINPSFVLENRGKLILINEIEEKNNTRILTPDGELEIIFSSGGIGPCHINSFLDYTAISNYTSGTISLLKNNELLDSYTFSGSGPNPRQESSHVHSSVYSGVNSILYSIDLGRDSIDSFKIENNNLVLCSSFKLKPGDGPRMMGIEKNRGYIVNELSNSVTVVDLQADGSIVEKSRYSTLPENIHLESYASHIEIHNQYIYISNRGYDSIVRYPITGEGLGEPHWIILQGSFPRHFLIDSNCLFVANQESNSVEVIDLETTKYITSMEIYKPTVVTKL